jgi:hypothetical protein
LFLCQLLRLGGDVAMNHLLTGECAAASAVYAQDVLPTSIHRCVVHQPVVLWTARQKRAVLLVSSAVYHHVL